MVEREIYIGSFSSPFLGKGLLWGYGILATDIRLVGYKNVRAGIILLIGPMVTAIGGFTYLIGDFLNNPFLASSRVLVFGICLVLGIGILAILISRGPAIASTRPLHEIEKSKDFEVRKDLVSEIQVTSPLWFDLGCLAVSLKSGETVNIRIANQSTFRKTIELVRGFYPEVRVFPSP